MKVRIAFVLFVYIVAVNIPLWIATHFIGFLLTGLFNVELVVLGILSVFLRRMVTVVLLPFVILLDIARGIGMTYLLRPSEMINSTRYLSEAVPSHFLGIVAVVACIGVVCLLGAVASGSRLDGREQAFVASALTIFVVVCGAVDVATGHTSALRRDYQAGAVRLTRFPSHALVMSELNHRRYSAGANVLVPAASKVMVRFDGASVLPRTNAMAPNVVLILVESWGRPLAADLEGALVRPYGGKELSEKYTVERGTVPFYGPTVAGEARELCSSAMGFGLLTAPRSQLKDCLPTKMRMLGYHSVAVHGFSARMFDRGEWYGRIGFDETWFREQLQAQGLPLCPGPFPGTCDAAVSEWIGDQLQREADSPQFIYWVTLNSHLPVPLPNLVKAPPSCSDVSSTAEDPAMCSWYQLVFNVHRSVSELALRSTTRPTVFLIVGDHAPPFSSSRLRSQFSDRVVPYILLTPKRGELREGPQPLRSFAVATHTPSVLRRPHWKKGRTSSFLPAAE